MTPDQFQLGLLVASASALLLITLLLVTAAIAAWAWWRAHTHGSMEWNPKYITVTLHEDRSADVVLPVDSGTAHRSE